MAGAKGDKQINKNSACHFFERYKKDKAEGESKKTKKDKAKRELLVLMRPSLFQKMWCAEPDISSPGVHTILFTSRSGHRYVADSSRVVLLGDPGKGVRASLGM